MPRLKIAGKVYATESLNDISLANLLIFKSQAAPFTWADVQRLADELDSMEEAEAEAAFERDPEYLLPLAVMVWLARKNAGEAADFWDAIDISPTEISFTPEPGDKKPGKAKGAKKALKASLPKSSVSTGSDLDDEPRRVLEQPSTSMASSGTSGAA